MGILKRTNKAANTVVGLELDPGHIAAAEVSVNGSIMVKRGAVASLPPGLLRDGEASDPPALASALDQFFEEHQLPRRVRLGIANQRIVVRSLDLPVTSDAAELDTVVLREAPDHIPMPMDEAVLDFQSLGDVDTPEGPRTRVLVVAVRREMIERLHAACDAAGLEVDGIDLSAFALVRALPQPPHAGATLYISVAGLVNVAVANNTGCLFTRAAAGGLEEIASGLAERRGLTLEHAHQWLRHVGLETPLEALEGDADLVAAARSALEDGIHQLADAVRNSLNFYRMQDRAESVDNAVVTGPVLAIPGFVARLSEQLQMPLEPALIPLADGVDDAGRLTIAAGLGVAERA
jgi:type IV pilus assembly protein PilM